MAIFYSSDFHLGHSNIIKYSGRPFTNAKEMDEAIIERHNSIVKPNDHWWYLGDLTMERGSLASQQAQDTIRLVNRLQGHGRILLGNHDHFPFSVYIDCGFEKIQASHVHDNILFTHIPIHPRSMGRFIANVHGHTHAAAPYDPVLRVNYEEVWEGKEQVVTGVSPYINICVEQTHYAPISLEEVKGRIKAAVSAWSTGPEEPCIISG